MPRKRSKAKQLCPQNQTHLGWRSGASGAACGQDHLLLSGSWQAQANQQTTQSGEPLVQFLEESESPSTPSQKREQNPLSDIGFTEVLDSTLEAAPMLWDGNWDAKGGDSIELNTPIIFESENNPNKTINTVFS